MAIGLFRETTRLSRLSSDKSRSSAERALDAADNRFRAQLGDDRVEVLQIPDGQIDDHVREVLSPAFHRDILDVAVVIGDDLRDGRQGAGLVDRLQGETGGKALLPAIDVP